MAESNSEDDDVVVKEFDVVLNKSDVDNLYVLQYPLQPHETRFSELCAIKTRIKPKQNKIEIKAELDTRSTSYDKSKGEQIVINCGPSTSSASSSKTAPNLFSSHFSNRMDCKKLLSANCGALNTGTSAIGVMKDGRFYINPVKTILQMRPVFDYIDVADEKGGKNAPEDPTEDVVDADGPAEDSETETPQAVTMKFAKTESEATKKRRQATFSFQEKLKSEESWLPLTYHRQKDERSSLKRQKLCESVKSEPDQQRIQFPTDPDVCLRHLAPLPEENDVVIPKMPNNVISLADLRKLPLMDQICALMLNVKVIRFVQLLSLLPPHSDHSQLVKLLQQYATLVQGCWVVKSPLLYPENSKSSKTGVIAEVMCRARDYVLHKFTTNRYVNRKQISEAIKLPSEDLLEILNQMAKFRVYKGWEFAVGPDEEFIRRHPEVVEKQRLMWENRYAELLKVVVEPNTKTRRNSGKSAAVTKGRKRSTSKSFSMSEDETNGQTVEAKKRHDRERKMSDVIDSVGSGNEAKTEEPEMEEKPKSKTRKRAAKTTPSRD